MIQFEWFERNPLLSFLCASLVLYFIYGIGWTIVIIFTIYLLDKTFKDTEGERIYGKPLVNVREKQKSSSIVLNNKVIYRSPHYTKMSNNSDNVEKRPTLQSLLYQKRTKCDTQMYRRQPLAAVVKNNIQLNLSPNIDLEKRKPIYQTIRSPSIKSTSSLLTRRNASPIPFINRASGSYIGLNTGSPLNRSNVNNTSFNTSVVAPLNDSLEVHGSYFINKSVLHSPSIEKPKTNNGYFSPSNVTFDVRSPISNSTQCSTESVVEALKKKSKRKRAVPELLDETGPKKKKNNSDDIDSTLHDLLPNVQQPSIEQLQISKRKNVDTKEVKSTGVQCFIDDDETIVRKKKKLQTESDLSKLKYGLSQGEINKLSSETTSVNDAEKMDIPDIVDGGTLDSEKNESNEVMFKSSVRNIAYDCSFKSVSFADTTHATPDKKQTDSINKTEKSSLKLSALKNMESPYKKLFNAGVTHNISPASIKKMRKHPVYFTAKINIDEVQQHREEFGESGVSLKAFRLDQEEAIKRVNSLFDDTDGDIDLKVQTVSKILSTTQSTLTIASLATAANIASGISTNLFASSQPLALSSSIAKSTSSLLFGSTALSTATFSLPTASGLSFGSSTSTVSLPQVTSLVSTKVNSVVATTILTALQLQSGLSKTDIQPKSVAPAFTFGTLPGTQGALPGALPGAFTGAPSSSALPPYTSTAIVVSSIPSVTSITTSAIPQVTPAASNNFNFSFGTAATPAATGQQQSLQFPSIPTVSSTAIQPESNKISFSITTQVIPANTNPTTASTIVPPIVPPVSNSAPYNFSFQAQPQTSTLLQSTNQNATISVNPVCVQQPATVSTGALFGTNTSTLPNLNFAAASTSIPNLNFAATSTSIVQPGLSFPTAATSTNVSICPPISSINPTLPSIFGQQPSGNNIFAASLSTTTTQPPMFGNTSSAATITVPQPSMFGTVPSAPITTLQSSMFGSSSIKTEATSQSSVFGNPAPAPAFNQAATTIAASTMAAGNVFAPQTKPNGGFSFPSAAPSTGFNFGASLSGANAAPSSASTFSVPVTQSTFSVPVTQSSMFGQAVAPTTNVQVPQNMFGAPSATTSQPIFGAPTVSVPSTQNIFGAAASSVPSTQGIFGSNTQSAFGSTAQNSFGASSTQSVFGAAQQQPSMFGDQSKIGTGFNFGATAATTAPSGGFAFGTTTSTSSVFGQSNNVFGAANPTNNPGIFGAAKPTENVFGQQPKPASGFDFSASLSHGPTLNFGAAAAPVTVNGFAPQQQQAEIPKPSFNFGAQPQTPTFGSTPASPAFGGGVQQPVFGSAQPFGTPNAGAGGGFTIGAGTSNPPPTRQTQRARRRLRR